MTKPSFFFFLLLLVASFFELAAATNICTWGYYMCSRTSQCIQSRYRCDGRTHCTYGEDESNCPSRCSGYYSYYRCSNNVCISRSSLCNGVNNCADGSDESTALCGGTAFPMRLVGGRSSNEGRVEVYYSPTRSWGTICDDGWDINDANVVCRQLGLSRATQAPGSARFGQGSGPILLDDVQCTGSELTLSKCSSKVWKSHDCSHSEDAGVVCGGSPLPSPTSRLTCYLCHSPSSCRNPRSHQCSAGVRNCIKSKATTTTGGQETEIESALCDESNRFCSNSFQQFCGSSKNCKRKCCSTSYCNDPRDGYGSAESSKETKCYTCTSSSSYKDCETKSVLRTCNSGLSTCYKADHATYSPTTGSYGQTSGSRRYGKGCVSSSQCTKNSLSFCNSYLASDNDCNVHCCTGDGCNAGSGFRVSGVLLSACVIVLVLLL